MNCPAAGGETLRITYTRRPPGLVISGEIDEITYADLVSALERFADGPGEIHIGLAGVEYCDLAGLRAILSLARGNGPSRSVVLHDVPPASKGALRILGWDTTPGLTIDERPWQPAGPGGPGSPGSARQTPVAARTSGGDRGRGWGARLRNSLIPRARLLAAGHATHAELDTSRAAR